MPEQIRALIVILVLAAGFFLFSHHSACAIVDRKHFTRRRNLWFILTISAFLANSFWIYILFAIPLIIYAKRSEPNPPALYFFLLFVLPMATIQIPGGGLINYFFALSHARVLSLFILLPAFLTLLRQDDTIPFGYTKPDKVIAASLLLTALLYLRETTLTDTLRQAFYLFLDVFLPYFVISRSLKNLPDFRDSLLSLVMAIMVLAPLAIFESYKHWLLYSAVTHTLKLEEGMTGYMGRGGILRAITAVGQPIALGYLMVVGMGLYLFLQRYIQKKLIRWLGIALLVAGLLVPVSRGPWIGAAVLIIVFVATGRYAIRRLLILALTTMLVLPVVSALPGGDKMINMLPFIGTTNTENVNYREKLITNSMIVLQRNPWFGSVDFLNTPEMQSMRQGEGIIDIVNTYIGIALEQGYIGLGLFSAFFALTLLDIYRAIHSIPDKDSEEHLLGRALLSTLIAILIIIFTVSSISIIPIVYWSFAGLGIAYAQMVWRKY